MKSNVGLDPKHLERDIPTTEQDVAALRRARRLRAEDLDAYLRFLEALGPASRDELLSRTGPRGDAPFEL